MLKLIKNIKNQLLRFKRKVSFFRRFNWRSISRKLLLPACILLGFGLMALLIIFIKNLPAKAPNFKALNNDTYQYQAENKLFGSKLGIREEKPIVSFNLPSGENLVFSYAEAVGNPTLQSQTEKSLVFSQVEPGIDLRYETLTNGLKEEIILRQPRQKTKDAHVFTFDSTFQGAYPKETIKGFAGRTFYNQQGKYLFHFEKPFALDAAGNRTEAVVLQIEDKSSSKIPDLKKAAQGELTYTIRLTVDESWLSDPDRIYPIIIDPTIVHDESSEFVAGTYNRVKDTGTDFITSATGGSISTSGGYTIHTFTTSGTFTPIGNGTVEYLVVGAGGGGNLGGGGGGGVRTGTYSLTNGVGYTVTIGAGAAGAAGGNSVFGTVTAAGGGQGGTFNQTGFAGGSGGGGGENDNQAGTFIGGSGTVGQGNNGGTTFQTLSPNGSSNGAGGGGGGAVGGNSPNGKTGGVGGAGTASSISGASVTYGGGGGGGATTSTSGATGGAGGSGGGGAGAAANNGANTAGSAGTANTGGGGGGGNNGGPGAGTLAGYAGGSGIVIVRYPTNPTPVLETYYQELATDENTVGLWHLNELAGGGDAIDYSGNNNTGTAIGTSVVDGILSKARSFNGSSEYISIPNTTSMNLSSFTYSAWVKINSFAARNTIIDGGGAANTPRLGTETATGLFNLYKSGVVIICSSSRAPALGQWTHVSVTYDGNSCNFYINGEFDKATVSSQTFSYTAVPRYIGVTYGTAEFFNGQIDEVQISSVIRTPEEIKSAASRRPYSTYTSDIIDLTGVNSWNSLAWLENGVSTGDGETPKDSTNLIAQWNLNSISGTTATNDAGSCGASCNGTLTNFTLTSGQDQNNSVAMATGGTITYSGGYTIHTFTGNGTFTPSVAMNVETLVVGGGGGGANTGSGGGGGGYVHNTAFAVTATAYPITVGGGGAGGATTAAPGTVGGNSIFSTITAYGGGAGTSHGGCYGGNGGSGGGGPISTTCTATGGTASQGYAGGAGYLQAAWTGGSGGGGGAGGVGTAGGNTAGMGNGGVGLSNSISGTAVFYAGGGGGGEVNGSYVGTGGNGGGGTAVLNAAGGNGTANTGGGGAGGSYTGTYFNGGNGGSGIVIIRYPTKPSGWTANNKKWGAGALQFDGLNDYVSIPDSNSLSFGNAGTDTPFSISTWVKPSSLNGASNGNWIVNKRDGGSGDEYQLVFYQKQIYASLFTSNGNSIAQFTNRTWDPGNWYNIVMTYDGSKTVAGIKIYVNGKLEPTTVASVGSYTGMNNGSAPVNIGKPGWSNSLYFEGVIDSTKIFSRALTASEILSNYNMGQIELQTRVGSDASPDDGSWETWKPTTTEDLLKSLDDYSPLSCAGGEVLEGGRIHKFTSSDTFTCTGDGKVEVLVVAGGGGGGTNMGGGGGGGGVIYNPSVSITNGTPYTVTVGAGGNGAPAGTVPGQPNVAATNGGNSAFGSLTAIGGGAGGSSANGTGIANGSAGGSGGGASGYNSDASAPGAHPGGTGTTGQGFRGGGQGNAYYSGGGGGAGGAGADGNNKANGGIGYYSDILGEGYYWGGGGGGGGYTIAGGNGGAGGGGGGAAGTTYGGSGINNGSPGGGGCTVCWTQRPGGDGGPNTGGGGGGGGHYFSSNKGGNGGSGIVIVRLSPTSKDTTIKTEGTGSQKINTNSIKADKNTIALWHLDETGGTGSYLQSSTAIPFATGGTVSYSGGYTIHTFYESGTFMVNGSGSVETLIVAGGGGGGSDMGGGGGGGGVISNPSVAVSTNAYTVTVGAGGAGSPGVYAATPVSGSNGGNSSFNSLVAIGGGGGGSGHRTDAPYVGGNAVVGGSGGGSAARYMYSAPQSLGALGTAGQGTRGGNAPSVNSNYYGGGGGGAGGNAEVDAVNATRAGNGGPGIASSILGTTYYFGAGGGGAGHTGGPAGNGGMGGGGGASTWAAPSTAGAAGTGGIGIASPGSVAAVATVGGYAGTSTGSGGGGGNHQGNGGAGGSGIVVIRYPTSYSPVTINNNGTPNGTSVTDGISKKARNFNGSGDYISVPNSTTLDFKNNNFTIEWWEYRTDASSTRTSLDRGYNNDGVGYSPWLAGYSSATQLSFYATSCGSACGWDIANAKSMGSITTNQWVHLAVTRNGDAFATYKNGIQQDTWTSALSIQNGIGNMGIGKYLSSVNGSFKGKLDEIRISNIARSATEIAESYRAGRDSYVNLDISNTDLSNKKLLPFYVAADRPGSYLTATIGESAYANYQADQNTVGLWHLEEQSGAGTYIKDSSGNKRDGAPTATTAVQGKFGKGRNFTASTDNIATTTTSLGLSTAITAEAWVYPTGTDSSWNWIVSQWPNPNGTGAVFNLSYSTAYMLHFNVQSCSAGLKSDTATTALTLNKWNHVAATFDASTGVMNLYINGVLNKTSTGSTGTICNASLPVTFGKSPFDAIESLKGSIDEVRISNIVRSADEIRQAYEVGMRSHSITIDFAAYLVSSNLIDDVNDKSFVIDTTPYGTINKGSKLYKGEKIIVRENYNDTEYIAQGDITSIDEETGATAVAAWDSGSTFPGVGFTPQADVFKWQREYWNLSAPIDSQLDAVTQISLRLTDGNEGRTVWLDDFKSSGDYLTNPLGSILTNATGNRYFQYRAIISSADEAASPSISSVTLDYAANSIPAIPSLDSPTDAVTNQSSLPTLLTTTTDTDSDYLRYKIELCTNLAMTTSCQTFDQTLSQTGWSGQNADSSQAYTSGTQASYTLQSDLLANTTYYWRSYAIDPVGTGIWSATQATPYSFTTSAAPDAPTVLYTEGLNNPPAVADLTPEFSAIHNDSNGDNANYYEIEVNTASDFTGTVMWDSGKLSMTSTANGVRSPNISYAGTTLNFDGTVYYWRIRFWDIFNLMGAWSAVNNFTMNSSPNIPSLDAPLQGNLNTYFKPTLLTTTTDTDSDYLRYKIELCTNLAMTTSCQTFDQTLSQTGWSGQNADSSQAYTSGTQASYTLQSDLLANTTYYWRSYAIDPVGGNVWGPTQSTPNNFTTLNAPLPASACFIQESITDDQLQIIWTDNASNEDFYEVQRSVDGGAWTTLQTGLAANTINLTDSTISSGHTYQYRIAPYFTGPFYSAWCTASSLNLGVGLFNLEGINVGGLHFN